MTPEQEAHLDRIKQRFAADVDAKYRAGQAEHGGDLWRKPAILRMLRAEALDSFTYQQTAEDQVRDIARLLSRAISEQGWDLVNAAVDRLLAMVDGEAD